MTVDFFVQHCKYTAIDAHAHWHSRGGARKLYCQGMQKSLKETERPAVSWKLDSKPQEMMERPDLPEPTCIEGSEECLDASSSSVRFSNVGPT